MDKKKDSKLTVKTALMNTVANVISLVVGMVMVPIIARVLSEKDLGIASTFLATRNTLVILATLAVYAFVNRAMLDFEKEKKDYIFSITVFCIAMVGVIFLISLPFREFLQQALKLDDFLYYWLFISCLSFALYSIGDYYCIFHNKSLIIFFIVLCCGPAAQFLSVGLALVMPQGKYIGRVLGLDATYVVVAVVLLVWLLFSGRHSFRRKYITRTLKFTVPVIPHLLSQMVLTQCDLMMITAMVGEAESGIYSMAHTVGFLAFTVMSQLMAAWSPWVYRRLSEGDTGSIRENSGFMVLLGMYLTIGLLTISPELIRIFLTEAYLPCIYIVPPLVLAMFFQFIYLFFYDLEYYYKKPQWIACASVAAAVLNLILNFIFIPRFGYIAACYTTVASYFVLLLLNYVFAGKLGAKQIYNMRLILANSCCVILYMALMFVFVDVIWVRYLILAVITLLLFAFEAKKIAAVRKSLWGEKGTRDE